MRGMLSVNRRSSVRSVVSHRVVGSLMVAALLQHAPLALAADAIESEDDATLDLEASNEPRTEEAAVDHDELVLVGGGFVRGTIDEIVPGSHVVIIPSRGGDAREIAWSDVDVIRRGTGGSSSGQDPFVPAAPPDSSEDAPRVTIEVSDQRSVTLYQVTGEAVAVGTGGSAYAMSYRGLCDSPCNRPVAIEPGARYFIGGDRVTPSKHFRLPEGEDSTLQVRAGSKGLRIGGLILASIGIPFAIGGASILGVASTLDREESPRSTFMTAGGAMLGVGLVALAAGIPMMIVGRTRVQVR